MAVITQNYDVDLKATGERPVVEMSQFDTGSRTIVFTVYDGHDLANIDGMVARVDGTRSDGVEFSSTCTVGTGSKVSFEINQEMTKHAGKHAAELVIFDASGNPIGTQNFIIDVEAAPMVRDSAASADDRTLYDQYTDSVEAKFNSLSASLTAKADELNKTVQDIDALLGGSSKQTTIFDVSVDASTTGTGITGTALAHAEYDPITGLVTFVAKTVDGLHGVKGAQQFQLGAIDSKYLPGESLFKSDGWSDGSKVFLLGYDRIDDTGYGAEAYISKDGKVYASFVYPATATGDENAYRPVFYATWYARGGKFIGVTPMTGGNTLTIGKTTTGEPGTQASVVNSGTAKDVVLDFTIPRGADGTGGGSGYTLPAATSSTLGGVKIGSGISVTSDGTISASSGGGSLSVEQYNLSDWSVTADGVTLGDTISEEEVPLGHPSLLFYKYGERLYAETMYLYLRTTGTVVNGEVFSFTYIKTGTTVDYSASDQNPLVGVAIFEEDEKGDEPDRVGTPLAPGYVTLIFEPKDEGSLVWGKVAVWLASPELKPNTNYFVSFSVSGLIHAGDIS